MLPHKHTTATPLSPRAVCTTLECTHVYSTVSDHRCVCTLPCYDATAVSRLSIPATQTQKGLIADQYYVRATPAPTAKVIVGRAR